MRSDELVYRFGHFELRPAQRQVLVQGRPAKLGARAYDVLMALFEGRDRTVGKNELLDMVWPGIVVEENNLQVQISTLRKLLGNEAISTIPGRGYRFTATHSETAENSRTWLGPRPARAQVFDASTSPLFGREDDLAALGALLSQFRLITVTGAGGVGKSRLAQRLAVEQSSSFDDGTFWVELAAINDPALVLGTIATATKTFIRTGDSPRQLAASIGSRQLLIMIDNAEHLAGEVARVVQALLQDAANVRVLVTSQTSLKVAGERVYRLGTLAVPEPDSTPNEALTYGAIALFVDRARAADRLFEFHDQNVATCISICRQLDGVPLAIELAAARVPLLGVPQLAGALDERLRLLSNGSPNLPGRQQTLRAALEWSYGLLTTDEQLVFRRLGVFVDGFSLELAQAAASDERIDSWAALDLLGHLIDKSLVMVDKAEILRYRLLETTRTFALEKLAVAGEMQLLVRRHAEALLAYLTPLRDRFWTLRRSDLSRAGAELENLRGALDWAVSSEGDRRLAYLLIGVSRAIWIARDQFSEGMERCQQLQPLPNQLPRELCARFHQVHGGLGYVTSREDCFVAAKQAADLFRELGDPDGLSDALLTVATVGSRRGEQQAVYAAVSEAEALVTPAWSLRQRAQLALAQAMWHLMCGREAQSLAAMSRQAALYGEDKDAFRLQVGLANAAMMEARLGRYDSAIDVLETALKELKRLHAPYGVSQVLGYLAFSLAMRNAEGDFLRSRAYAHAAWPYMRKERKGEWLFPAMALAFARHGILDTAARLLGHSDAFWSKEGFVPRPTDLRVREETLTLIGSSLSAKWVGELINEGVALGDDAAASLAFASE